jgi:predicted neutral ceramidase superfamily lipid hydrolase
MESKEPFKTMFKFFNIFGVWGENTKRYKRISFLTYIVCLILPGLLNFLSVLQAKTAEDAIAVVVFTPPIFITLCFTIFFIGRKDGIKEYLEYMDDILNQYPEAKPYIDTSYSRSKFICFTIYIFGVFCVFVSCVVSVLIGKLQMKFILPEVLQSRPETFYFLAVYQTIFFLYAGFLLASFQEFFFLLMVMMHGYFKFCESQFREMDIRKCVEVHLSLKR